MSKFTNTASTYIHNKLAAPQITIFLTMLPPLLRAFIFVSVILYSIMELDIWKLIRNRDGFYVNQKTESVHFNGREFINFGQYNDDHAVFIVVY